VRLFFLYLVLQGIDPGSLVSMSWSSSLPPTPSSSSTMATPSAFPRPLRPSPRAPGENAHLPVPRTFPLGLCFILSTLTCLLPPQHVAAGEAPVTPVDGATPFRSSASRRFPDSHSRFLARADRWMCNGPDSTPNRFCLFFYFMHHHGICIISSMVSQNKIKIIL
jgi:hypothetical protein